ncbi:hypothetical protein [Anaerovorax odorimutans]|uniref:hypothetical protein n=1 Tax=Anaerovorax odorimutans TaxID=109327 RepID=UPI00040381AB|nr:hypothetical protein [Anaerovorax odorimutans]
MNKKSVGLTGSILGCLIGLLMLILGLYMEKYMNTPDLLGAVIGALGIILLQLSVTNTSEVLLKSKYPEVNEKKNREMRDERNMIIRQKAAEKTNYAMLLVYSFIIFTLLIMDVELYIMLLMAAAMAAHGGLSIFFYNYYEKKM